VLPAPASVRFQSPNFTFQPAVADPGSQRFYGSSLVLHVGLEGRFSSGGPARFGPAQRPSRTSKIGLRTHVGCRPARQSTRPARVIPGDSYEELGRPRERVQTDQSGPVVRPARAIERGRCGRPRRRPCFGTCRVRGTAASLGLAAGLERVDRCRSSRPVRSISSCSPTRPRSRFPSILPTCALRRTKTGGLFTLREFGRGDAFRFHLPASRGRCGSCVSSSILAGRRRWAKSALSYQMTVLSGRSRRESSGIVVGVRAFRSETLTAAPGTARRRAEPTSSPRPRSERRVPR